MLAQIDELLSCEPGVDDESTIGAEICWSSTISKAASKEMHAHTREIDATRVEVIEGRAPPSFDEKGTTDELSRLAFVKGHGLDKLFAQAVDRAMRYKVSNPIEFVAHDMLRSAE